MDLRERVMEKTKNMPLFLFPGLACTERLFVPQAEELAQVCRVIVPEWTEPKAGESLRDFARRWGEAVWSAYYSPEVPDLERLDPADGCFVGGLSFGGMCAPFVGRVLQEHGVRVFACFGLATIQDGTQIPRFSRFLWRMVNFLPCGGWGLLKVLCGLSLKFFDSRFSMPRRETYLQLMESPCRRSHRVLKMIVGWRDTWEEYGFPRLHIHGWRDMLLPLRKLERERVYRVLDAGHLLTLTRPKEVNLFLKKEILRILEELESQTDKK